MTSFEVAGDVGVAHGHSAGFVLQPGVVEANHISSLKCLSINRKAAAIKKKKENHGRTVLEVCEIEGFSG